MRTYTHGVIAYLLYAKRSVQEQKLAVLGGVVPDLLLVFGFIFHFGERVSGASIVSRLHDLFHHSPLHTVTIALHSFVIILPLILLSYFLFRKSTPFFVGMCAHAVVDLVTHTTSTYNHLFPLPFAHVKGVFSYTSIQFIIIEHAFLVAFVAWYFLRRKKRASKKKVDN